MALNLHFCALLFFFFFFGFATSSNFISDEVFESHGSSGRTLLQAKKSCPVNFEFANYTIVMDKCKGPNYEASLCCGALTEFACPYADQLNDLTNDCALTMFSYLTLNGKYPPGLFSSECHGDKYGLACPAEPPGLTPSKNLARKTKVLKISSACIPMLMLSVSLQVFRWF